MKTSGREMSLKEAVDEGKISKQTTTVRSPVTGSNITLSEAIETGYS